MSVDDIISTSDVSGWDIGLAVLTLILTLFAFGLARRLTQAAVNRIGGLSVNMRAVIVRSVKYLVLLLGIGVALTFLGAQLQPLLTVVIVLFAIALLALRGVAENFGAGMVLQTRKPIAVGDEIESQGHSGVITELNGRAVVITTSDGRIVHLPNADVISNALSNNSARGLRRSEVQVRCTRGHGAVAPAVEPLIACALGVNGVQSSPPPDAVVISVDPERITVRLRFWHEPRADVRVTSDVVAALGEDLQVRQVEGTVTSEHPAAPLTPSPAL